MKQLYWEISGTCSGMVMTIETDETPDYEDLWLAAAELLRVPLDQVHEISAEEFEQKQVQHRTRVYHHPRRGWRAIMARDGRYAGVHVPVIVEWNR
ncbi:hypothetical protein [Desulfurispora thermophila]|uniref:hypothetical protein n=1 Tax=Desulfurispora thermophila TaxID=265470 RepID=UPI00037A15D4|nr:hypothetical protein [Desulfurispora thermophila]